MHASGQFLYARQKFVWLYLTFQYKLRFMKENQANSSDCLQPLETGQLWRMSDLNLKVGLVGKWLVHYKLAKPDAVRTPDFGQQQADRGKISKKEQGGLDSRISLGRTGLAQAQAVPANIRRIPTCRFAN